MAGIKPQTTQNLERIKRTFPIWIILLGASAAAGLVILAYYGLFNRLWGDDWCYSADFKELGILGALKGYTYITTYASNRYSLTFFSGLIDLFGIPGTIVQPALVLFAWSLGLLWSIRGTFRLLGRSITLPLLITSSALLTFYSFYLTPNLFQSLYWRTGMLTYTSAAIFGLYLAASILSYAVGGARWEGLLLLLTAAIAFFGAAFSEAGGATLAALTFLGIVIGWRGKHAGKDWGKRMMTASIIALLFTLTALLILALSPANAARQTASYRPPAPLWLVPFKAAEFSAVFLFDSMVGLPIPHLIIAAIFFGLGITASDPSVGGKKTFSQLVIPILLISVCIFLLLMAMHAPSAYIEQNPPAPRTMIIARLILTAGMAAIFGWIGASLPASMPRTAVAALVLLGAGLIYTVRAPILLLQQSEHYVKRAAVWDERHTMIHEAVEMRVEHVDVRAIDTFYMGATPELKHPRFWINRCAERVYGIKEIDASLSWDDYTMEEK